MLRQATNILASISLLLAVATATMWVLSGAYIDLWRSDQSSAERVIDTSRNQAYVMWTWTADRVTDRQWDCLGFELNTGWTWNGSPDTPGGSNLQNYSPTCLVAVPYWFILLLTLLLPAARVRRWLRLRHRRSAGLCPACGYDLRASPARCPECGRAARPT